MKHPAKIEKRRITIEDASPLEQYVLDCINEGIRLGDKIHAGGLENVLSILREGRFIVTFNRGKDKNFVVRWSKYNFKKDNEAQAFLNTYRDEIEIFANDQHSANFWEIMFSQGLRFNRLCTFAIENICFNIIESIDNPEQWFHHDRHYL